MRVVLTGFMGTGKTAVGQRVAQRLGRPFADTDALVEGMAGKTVRRIFAEEGEARFRELERTAVERACALGDAVVSTGGGALVDDRNFEALSRDALLVCLVADPRTIARRVRASAPERPLLRGGTSLVARIRELLEERAHVYARVPLRIETGGRSVEQVADEVIAALEHSLRATSAACAPAARPAGGAR
ncbi:MAG: shikimate kinase [Alphaproteobacteria bacterium]